MRRLVTLALAAALAASAAPAAAAPTRPADVTITLVAHDSYNVSKSVIRAFTRSTGIHVKVLRGGDAGQTLNQVILTKDHPIGDVLYGVDNTFLSRALDAGIYEPYTAKDLGLVPSQYVLDPRHRVTPVDRSDVCINDDKQWFADHHVERPTSLGQLTQPGYRDTLVTENPATSSTGLSFLLATIAKFGENGWHAYWQKLRANGLKVVDGWEQAWYDNFTAAGHGGRPLVVSYASSPPDTVNKAGTKARAGTLLSSCFQQIEFVGVLKGTAHRAAARKLVDFMLSKAFQEDMPGQMYVFPVRQGAQLPALFAKFADVPEHALALTPQQVEKNRERWIDEWTDIVLR